MGYYKPKHQRLTHIFTVRFRGPDFDRLSRVADRHESTISAYIRDVVLAAVTEDEFDADAAWHQAHKDDTNEWGDAVVPGRDSWTENLSRIRWVS